MVATFILPRKPGGTYPKHVKIVNDCYFYSPGPHYYQGRMSNEDTYLFPDRSWEYAGGLMEFESCEECNSSSSSSAFRSIRYKKCCTAPMMNLTVSGSIGSG